MNEILLTRLDRVCIIELNRPEKKNALTSSMYEDLKAALSQIALDTSINVLVLSGGNEVFSAGNDLEDFINDPPMTRNAPVFEFVRALMAFPKPIIAAVNGLAIGIGATILLHCDLVYATEKTRFSFPFVSLGVVPEAGSTLLLPRLMGYQQAAEKLFFGEVFTGEEAQRLGMVNRLISEGDLLTYVLDRAVKLAALPAGSLRLTKQLLKGNVSGSDPVAELYAQVNIEADIFTQRLQGPATKEALAAFMQKRAPVFSTLD